MSELCAQNCALAGELCTAKDLIGRVVTETQVECAASYAILEGAERIEDETSQLYHDAVKKSGAAKGVAEI